MDAVSGQAFREARDNIIQDVRRGIVRICFDWNNGVVIISGLIIRRNGNSYEILANGQFLKESKKNKKENFVVRFPTSTQELYGQEITVQVNSPNVRVIDGFIKFDLTPHETEAAIIHGYVRPVTFEMEDIPRETNVDVFYFPRERKVTSAIYSQGSMVDSTIANDSTLGISFNDSSTDEYAQFGSPLFNHRGHLIGIMFNTQARLHAWSVPFLRDTVLVEMRPIYCRGGIIELNPPGA